MRIVGDVFILVFEPTNHNSSVILNLYLDEENILFVELKKYKMKKKTFYSNKKYFTRFYE
jgi:hypothetical protein